MKKHLTKKVVLTVLSLLFAISLAMGLSACGRNDNPPDAIEVTSVSLSQSELSLKIGDSETLIATVSPSNATDKSVTWTSSAQSVATGSDSCKRENNGSRQRNGYDYRKNGKRQDGYLSSNGYGFGC